MSEHGGLRGSCAICQSLLTMTEKVSALQCGHTFHFTCVSQWLGVKRECPNCRKKVNPKSGVIQKLFFDTLEFDGNETTSQVNYMEKAEQLAEEVTKLRDAVKEKEKSCEELQKEVKSLEKKILKEREKYNREIPALKARNRHLEMMESDLEGVKRELNAAIAKLKASEFYRLIFEKNGENVESAMQKFLQDDGHLNMETFFQTMKKQNSKLKTERSEAVKEADRLRQEMRPMKKEIQEKDDVIKALRKEIESLRRVADVDTPINKRLRAVLMMTGTPEDQQLKRKSLGFDRTNLMEDDGELSYFQQKEEKENVKNGKRKIIYETLDDTFIENPKKAVKRQSDEDEEDFDDSPIFKKMNKNRKRRLSDLDKSSSELIEPAAATAKIAEPNDSFDFSFDISVPSTVMRRVPVKATTTTKVEKVEKNVENHRKKNATTTKNARISTFFSRQPSSSDINRPYVNIVTLD